MLRINEVLLLKELAIFADTNGINKSELARKLDTTPKTIRSIINKFKECKINVRK